MNKWDERYRVHETVYGVSPNRFMASHMSLMNPGKAAFPCDGEGRNGVWAAEMGWDVWSFDASAVGVEKAQALAKKKGVRLDAVVGDAFEVAPGQQFDLVVLVFAHMPELRRKEFHQRAWSWVKPGGQLLVEGFHRDQLGLSSGGPKDLSMLFDETTLVEDIKGSGDKAQTLWSARCTQVLDEGPFHQGLGVTCQWVMKKSKP